MRASPACPTHEILETLAGAPPRSLLSRLRGLDLSLATTDAERYCSVSE